eukprot:1438999-Amphidinium_carterae.1
MDHQSKTATPPSLLAFAPLISEAMTLRCLRAAQLAPRRKPLRARPPSSERVLPGSRKAPVLRPSQWPLSRPPALRAASPLSSAWGGRLFLGTGILRH